MLLLGLAPVADFVVVSKDVARRPVFARVASALAQPTIMFEGGARGEMRGRFEEGGYAGGY